MEEMKKRQFVFDRNGKETGGKQDFIFHRAPVGRIEDMVKAILEKQHGKRLSEEEVQAITNKVFAELFRKKAEEWFGPAV